MSAGTGAYALPKTVGWDSVSVPDEDWDAVSTPLSEKDRIKAAAKKDLAGRPFGERAMINLGAGADTIVQGTKQILGMGAPEDEIVLGRELKDVAADSTTGGGLLQVGGEVGMTLPLGMGVPSVVKATAARALPRVAAAMDKLGSVGGRVFNLGNAGKGAAQGAATGALTPVIGDESRGVNAAIGGTVGAVAPTVLTVGASTAKKLSKSAKNTLPRAMKAIEEHLGPQEAARVRDIIESGGGTPHSLPLSTAAKTESESLGALERGSRRRDASWGREHDAPVAERAWNWMQDATRKSEELGQRKLAREDTMQAGREFLKTQKDPWDLKDATDNLNNVVNSMRDTSEFRVYDEVRAVLSDAESIAANPARNANDYSDLWFKLNTALDKVDNTVAKNAIKELQDSVADAADVASNGEFSAHLGRYKAEQGLVNESEALKNIRDSFQTPEGVSKTARTFDTPEITSTKLQSTLAQKGENEYGTLIDPNERTSLTTLQDELRRHEMHKPGNSPGATNIEEPNYMGILATGRQNPIYNLPGLKGLVEKTIGRGDKATGEAVDAALRSPEAYLRMIQAKEALGRPLTEPERVIRKLLLQSSRAAAAGTVGD